MAGLGRRTFQAGEVLTASNVMAYLQDQTVMNFAGTAARGSAIGTAVSEGMVSYLADSNVVQAYDGSAWNSLAYSSSVVTPGLIPVAPTSVDISGGSSSVNSLGQVSFSGVSSISLNGVFTSAYANYKIVINAGGAATGNNMFMRLRAAGTDRTNSNHYYGGQFVREQGNSAAWAGTGVNYFPIFYLLTGDKTNSAFINITCPQISTTGTSINWQAWSNDGTGGFGTSASGYYSSANSNDGFTFYTSGSATGFITVYGYND